MRIGTGFVVAAVVAVGIHVPAYAKPKVASIDSCMNQYVLALADPDQILSLSKSVQNPWSSYLYKKAIAIHPHFNNRKAEELLRFSPDIVFASYRKRDTIAMLRHVGVQVEQFPVAKSIDEVKRKIMTIAHLLEQDERGRILTARIDAAVERGRKTGLSDKRQKPLAALYNDGGYSRGGATLVDELMEIAGFRNLVKELGYNGGAKVPLEYLVLARPKYMIKNTTGKLARKSKRLASDIMDHPALKRAMPNSQRIIFPTVYWLCGGESTPIAIDYLIHEAQLKRQHVTASR